MKKKIKKETIVKIMLCCVLAMVVFGLIWFVVTQIRKATLKPPQDSFYYFEGYTDGDERGSVLLYYDASNGTVTECDRMKDCNVCNVYISNDKTMLLGEVHYDGTRFIDKYLFCYEIATKEAKWVSLKEVVDLSGGTFSHVYPGDGEDNCIYFSVYVDHIVQYYVYDFDNESLSEVAGIPNEIDYRTDDVAELVDEKEYVFSYSFSGNGSKILYKVETGFFTEKLYVYDLDTGEKTCVASGVEFGDIGWAGESYIYEEAYPGVFDYMNPTIITGALDTKEVKVSTWEGSSLGGISHEIINNQ